MVGSVDFVSGKLVKSFLYPSFGEFLLVLNAVYRLLHPLIERRLKPSVMRPDGDVNLYSKFKSMNCQVQLSAKYGVDITRLREGFLNPCM